MIAFNQGLSGASNGYVEGKFVLGHEGNEYLKRLVLGIPQGD